jgi:hypothetical protein
LRHLWEGRRGGEERRRGQVEILVFDVFEDDLRLEGGEPSYDESYERAIVSRHWRVRLVGKIEGEWNAQE